MRPDDRVYRRTQKVNEMNYPKVSIVMTAFNSGGVVRKSLNSLLELDYPSDYEIIVINNGSKDGTKDLLEKEFSKNKKIRLIHFKENQGVCKGRNAGIKIAKFEILVNMDHDCIASKSWLKGLMGGFDSPNVGVVTSYGGFGGTSTAFRTAALKKLGGYDEDYFYFREDTDIAFKFIEAGYEFKNVKADYVHDHQEAKPKNFLELIKYAWQRINYRKNDVLLFKKHPRLATPFLHIKYGFLVNPKYDMSVVLGGWWEKDTGKKDGKKLSGITSPRGFTLISGSSFFHRIMIYLIAFFYMLVLKFRRLIASVQFGKLLI